MATGSTFFWQNNQTEKEERKKERKKKIVIFTFFHCVAVNHGFELRVNLMGLPNCKIHILYSLKK